jgi:hypothetical protein
VSASGKSQSSAPPDAAAPLQKVVALGASKLERTESRGVLTTGVRGRVTRVLLDRGHACSVLASPTEALDAPCLLFLQFSDN